MIYYFFTFQNKYYFFIQLVILPKMLSIQFSYYYNCTIVTIVQLLFSCRGVTFLKLVLLFNIISNTFLEYTIRSFFNITIVPLLQLYNCCFGRGVTPFSELVILFYIIRNTFLKYSLQPFHIITMVQLLQWYHCCFGKGVSPFQNEYYYII